MIARPAGIERGRGGRAGTRALVAMLAALTLTAAGSQARAAGGFETGFGDFVFLSPDAGERDLWLDRAVSSRAGLVRLNVSWRAMTAGKPAAPANPQDPAYDFSTLDAAVKDAVAHRLDPVLMLFSAPDFAEGADRPGSAAPGTWKPSPGAFGKFAKAVASRYSGKRPGLPRVRYFQAWNEPNLDVYLSPQWAGRRQFAAPHYSRMLRAFNDGVKSVNRRNTVISGGTGPYGEPAGGTRTRPLTFVTRLLCLNAELEKRSCSVRPRFDVLAHHPITTSGGPRTSALHPNDVTIPDLGGLVDALRAAERRGTLAGGRHALWVTEFWWESNPPDTCTGIGPGRHARWLAEALYLLWKQGVDKALYFQIVDSPIAPGECGRDSFQTGVFDVAGKPKPAARAFRFPLVARRENERRVNVWMKAPVAGKVRVQRRAKGGWKTIASTRVRRPGVETLGVRLARPATLRAVIGSGQRSLPWNVR